MQQGVEEERLRCAGGANRSKLQMRNRSKGGEEEKTGACGLFLKSHRGGRDEARQPAAKRGEA